jgi:hypothetical protein
MRLTKYLIALTISLFAAPLLPAQVVVIDPAQIANNQANHIVDLAKYVEMVNNQLKQITTMTQELQQVTAYVKAFGDPSSLLNITGANQLISSLRQTGVGKTIGQLQQAANGIQAPQYTAACRTTADQTAAHRKSDQRRAYLCAGGLRKHA